MLAMNQTTTSLTFTVPITYKFKRKAESFRRWQSHPEKGEQVYFNTLAVLAANFYCQCIGIETNLAASDSWNPTMQTLADVADLKIANLGQLECRPVLANSQSVEIPAEVWGNRIGYIAVQLNESLSEAELVGFVKKVTAEELLLERWRSLEDFLEHIENLSAPVPQIIQLNEWLQGIFDAGWEAVEKVEAALWPLESEPAFRFRKNYGIMPPPMESTEGFVEGGKMVELEKAGEEVGLFVGAKLTGEPEIDVTVQLYAGGSQVYLPQGLEVKILDGDDIVVMEAIARYAKQIQLEFSAEFGEKFKVKLSLGDTSITEIFQA